MEVDQKQIANRLKYARVKKGFKSARFFSKHNNIAESTYAQHESGKRKLNISTLLKYCEKLSINPGWILTGEGEILFENNNHTFKHRKCIKANLTTMTMIFKILFPSIIANEISNNTELMNVIYKIYDDIDQHPISHQSLSAIIDKHLNNLKQESEYTKKIKVEI